MFYSTDSWNWVMTWLDVLPVPAMVAMQRMTLCHNEINHEQVSEFMAPIYLTPTDYITLKVDPSRKTMCLDEGCLNDQVVN